MLLRPTGLRRRHLLRTGESAAAPLVAVGRGCAGAVYLAPTAVGRIDVRVHALLAAPAQALATNAGAVHAPHLGVAAQAALPAARGIGAGVPADASTKLGALGADTLAGHAALGSPAADPTGTAVLRVRAQVHAGAITFRQATSAGRARAAVTAAVVVAPTAVTRDIQPHGLGGAAAHRERHTQREQPAKQRPGCLAARSHRPGSDHSASRTISSERPHRLPIAELDPLWAPVRERSLRPTRGARSARGYRLRNSRIARISAALRPKERKARIRP